QGAGAQRGRRGRPALRGAGRGRREARREDRTRMIDPVTNRYAEALYRLAKARGALEGVRADVKQLARQLGSGGALAFAFDARIALETRRSRLVAALASAHPLTQDFVQL